MGTAKVHDGATVEDSIILPFAKSSPAVIRHSVVGPRVPGRTPPSSGPSSGTASLGATPPDGIHLTGP